MDIKKLIRELETPACEICPRQADCEKIEGLGCLHLEAAVALKDMQYKVENLEAACLHYPKVAFHLGQADVREQAVSVLMDAADAVHGVTRAAVLAAADLVRELEVDLIAER